VSVFYCEHCQRTTAFLTVQKVVELATISRSTVYYWMERDWIHWRELPSGRRVICQESLSHSSQRSKASEISTARIFPKLSDAIQRRKVS
jgi:predicted DNA-binding transcriptional regulator AlpA